MGKTWGELCYIRNFECHRMNKKHLETSLPIHGVDSSVTSSTMLLTSLQVSN